MMPFFSAPPKRQPRGPRAWVGSALWSLGGLALLWLIAWFIGL